MVEGGYEFFSPSLNHGCERLFYAARLAILTEKKRTQWALTKEEMKNCVWLKPALVAQIEFTECTPDGHLRHSKLSG